ncbi:MAG: Rpn family recombination-promoting nuclease/putative transposase [Magnetococcales bacterium]|nr:Rpn family recombination-promoting nuclease/putative transposase [Magnetococcales bacterium]
MAVHINASDSLYHRFFAHPEMVIDLLRGFLDPSLLAELDLDNLRRHNTKFTAPRRGQRRRSDVVWEIPTRNGDSIFVLLILEFQSEIDEWMALRVDVYTGLLYQQLVNERKLKASDGLPPVLPIVLYNGEARWNAATSLRDLIRLPEGSSLWHFQPEMRYYVIDEGAYPKELLKDLPYITAILFRMEHPNNPEEIVRAGEDVAVWFRNHPDGPPVKQLFVELIMAGLERMKVTPTLPAIPDDLQEVVIMLTARVEQWAKDYESKGRLAGYKDGEQRGIERGEQQGEAKILTRQLQRRFGSLPDWANEKITKAKSSELEEWSLRLMDAPNSLEDVFSV